MSEFEKIVSEINKVINGKESAIRIILCAILANENVLIEDIPGTGKTTLVKAFSKVLQLTSKRIQMTSDTLPSDITGYSIYDKELGKFNLSKVLFSAIFFLLMNLTELQAEHNQPY